MWKTTADALEVMLEAADNAAVGSRREDYLDAGNNWIGASIRLKVVQTVAGVDVIQHERTHASGMTRSGEKLVVPNSGWTVVDHKAFDPANGPLRVVIEKSDDATKFFELGIGVGGSGSISRAVTLDDTLDLDLEITATNIFDPGTVAVPPAEFSYRIYDNPSAPVTVRPLVGMHFTDPDSIGGGSPYPPLAAVPGSQPSEISQAQPAYLTPTAFGSLGTTITRITDASMAHHYATWQAFNADQSMVLLWGSGGTILNVADWSSVRSGFDPGFVACFWDPVDPDIIWGHDGFGGGNHIYRYSVSANSSTSYIVPAASGSYNGVSIGAGEGSISADGKYLVLVATKSGSSDRFVIVWDAENNQVDGTLTLSGWGSDLDNAMISPSGDWIVLASLKSGERGHRIYDRATLTFQRAYTGGSGTDSSNGFTGHMDIGYRTNGDEVMVRQRNDGGLVTVRLSDGNERLEIPGSSFSWGNHISCRNIHRPGYAYVSMSYQSDQTTKPLYREIFSVKLDGEGNIERWGQAMFPNSGDYALQAKATASPHGDMVLFTSGWGTTTPREYVITHAGVGAGPGYDYDVFRTFDCPPLRWSNIETSDNNFSWTDADAVIDAAYNDGKRILFVVSNPPAFHVSTGPYPDGNWPALTRFVDAVMTRYAGKLWAVQWWSNPSRTSMHAEWAQGQVRTYRAVKAADPNVLVFLGGFRPSSGNTGVDQDVIAMCTTAYDGTEARNAADVLSFQSFGQTPSSEHALAVFRSMAATRAALRPALTLAMDMCGAHASFGGDFNESEHIQVIEQLLLLGVGFGAQLVGLYAHERQQEIGDPSSNANIRTAIDDIHGAITGKSMARAYVLSDGAVWIAFTDGTTVQSEGGTYTPPVDPDPDRDLRVHPFAINDVTNIKIGNTSVYADTSDRATNLVRASVGLNGSVAPSSQNPTPAEWSIPRYIASGSDPLREIRVYPPGASPSSAVSVWVRIPEGARPSRPWVPSDGHFSVINGSVLHEFWYVDPTVTPWRAGSYTPVQLDGASWGYGRKASNSDPTVWTVPGMAGWGSCRAFGGAANFGLIMPAELAAGLIPHVIGFAQRMQDLSTTNAPGFPHRWVWPATRDDGGASYTEGDGGVRQGQCFAIPKSFDIDAQPWIPYVKTIAKALQDYGAICIDQSGSTCIYLELTTRTPEMFAITDSSTFRTQLNQAWSQLRRITNHTEATPKGNT